MTEVSELTVSTPDSTEMSKALCEVAKQSSELLSSYMKRHSMPGDELGIAHAFLELTAKMMTNPFKLAEAQIALWHDYLNLWQASLMKIWGHEVKPVVTPAPGDKRFAHEDWENNFLFDYIKQSYLIAARHLHHAVKDVEGMDEQTARKVDFYTRQYIDAMAPTNFALTNPEVLRTTLETRGDNLVNGLNNLLKDLERGKGKEIRIRMTDLDAFKLGENIATTPGKVVYQNELMQLLQYAPTTDTVYKRPLLIIPPWINKFYILDLRERNSFIRWAASQGHTVFVISWVNPGVELAKCDFEDYLLKGPIAAMEAIEKATGEREVNAVGYCLGGTLLACTLGYVAVKGEQNRIASATHLTTLIDFEEPGELEVFIDDQQISVLEKRMEERGYLEGHEMAGTFNMLRANDLIWSFVVNNYLLGKNPFPFDLLYWNSDSTRMPAAMHKFYLRNFYQKNLFKEPGGITLAGVPIDVTQIRTPSYFLSTTEDHIAPWKSTYAGCRLYSGPVKFVLGGSGHIAGVVNPPIAGKYGYRTHPKLDADPEVWLAAARQNEGSWWTDWDKWVAKYAGEQAPARVPGKGKLKAIEDAPGAYVKVRLDAKDKS
jgi:poly[(R)-3-hydroxyalkanoate] polymerase subunit PhaC